MNCGVFRLVMNLIASNARYYFSNKVILEGIIVDATELSSFSSDLQPLNKCQPPPSKQISVMELSFFNQGHQSRI